MEAHLIKQDEEKLMHDDEKFEPILERVYNEHGLKDEIEKHLVELKPLSL